MESYRSQKAREKYTRWLDFDEEISDFQIDFGYIIVSDKEGNIYRLTRNDGKLFINGKPIREAGIILSKWRML